MSVRESTLSLPELKAAGLYRTLEPVLTAAGAATLVAAFLPSRWVAKDPVGWVESWQTGGAVGLIGLFVAAGGWWVLGRVTLDGAMKARLALGLWTFMVTGLAWGPDGPFHLHTVMLPEGLETARWWLLFSLGLSVAAGRLVRLPATPKMMGGLHGSAMVLWMGACLWPYPTGSWVQVTADLMMKLGAGEVSGRRWLTQVILLLLTPAVTGWAWWLSAPGRIRRAERSWDLGVAVGLVAFVEIIIGIRAASMLGADVYAAVGLRSALLILATVLVLGYALETLGLEGRPPSSRPRFWTALVATLGVGGHVAIVAVMFLASRAPHEKNEVWTLAPAPPWSEGLFRDRLTELSWAAHLASSRRGQEAFDRVVARTEVEARAVPSLARALRRWAQLAATPGVRQDRLGGQVRAINRAVRRAHLPFLVDLEYREQPEIGHRSLFILRGYRIVRQRVAQTTGGPRSTLWVRRLGTHGTEDLHLGWNRRGDSLGVVSLDAVWAYWHGDLAPVLTERVRVAAWARGYQRHGAALRRELVDAVVTTSGDETLRPAFFEMLDCLGPQPPFSPVDDSWSCTSATAAVEPWIIEVLAEKVGLHEAQHARDGAHPKIPAILYTEVLDAPEPVRRGAAAELSAYLSEAAHSDLPRLALVHFFALARQRPAGPEGYAGRVARRMLLKSGERVQDLIQLPKETLQMRARRAHQSLFGHQPSADALDV